VLMGGAIFRVPDQAPAVARSRLRSRASPENLVLRQQVIVLSRKSRSLVRPRNLDRLIFVWLYRFFSAILNAVVKPETVIRERILPSAVSCTRSITSTRVAADSVSASKRSPQAEVISNIRLTSDSLIPDS